MLTPIEFCRMANIRRSMLEAWIEGGWIRPRRTQDGWGLSMVDLARVRLILDLRGPMGVNDEGIAVILQLVDQIHGLRHALRSAALATAAHDLPPRSGPEIRTE